MSSIKSIISKKSADVSNEQQYLKKIYKSPDDKKFEMF